MTTNEGIMHLFLPFMDTLKPLSGSESEVSGICHVNYPIFQNLVKKNCQVPRRKFGNSSFLTRLSDFPHNYFKPK